MRSESAGAEREREMERKFFTLIFFWVLVSGQAASIDTAAADELSRVP